jgi:transcriptional regulator with XRE-family HTH domain
MDISSGAILKRIDDILDKRYEGRDALDTMLSIHESTVSSWRKSRPRADDIYRIAKYLEVSVAWLISGDNEDGLTDDERDLLDSYQRLDDRDRQDIVGLIAVKLERYPQKGVPLGAVG